MGGLAAGEGGSPRALPPAAGATLRAAACASGLKNCFQTAKTGGGRVGAQGKGLGFGVYDCVFGRLEP